MPLNINWDLIFNVDTWDYWLEEYADLGPLLGIGLPMLESFFPPLPLFAIVAGNAAAFGFWLGMLLSWIGTVGGSFIVFLIFRSFSKKKIHAFLEKHPKAEKFFHWVERKGFTPIFMLYSFPFSPSSLVSITAGVSTVPLFTYLTALAMGKAVVVFIMSFIGYDIFDIFQEPWRLILSVAIVVVLWLLGKRVEKRYIHSNVSDS